jgi:hypothetical protein
LIVTKRRPAVDCTLSIHEVGRVMAKFALYPVLLAAACVIAGIYGALHNQISFSVSPDYFFAFKFRQFGIPEEMRNRIGASLVGWYASWWMGLIIGVPVLLVGLIFPDRKSYIVRCLSAFAVVACTALVVGLSGLAWGYFTNLEVPALVRLEYPMKDVRDPVAFVRAGIMHKFSYLGGGIGILTGSAYLIVARLRQTRTRPLPE